MLKVPKAVKKELKATEMPIPKKMIRKAYIFGSSIQGIPYNDIDVAFMVDPQSAIFDDQLVIQQMDIGKVQYHILPDYPWFTNRLDNSSVKKRVPKRYFSDRLVKNSILHQLGFRGFIYKFASQGKK